MSNPSSAAYASRLNHFVTKGTEIQVGLRGAPSPLGPSKVEHVTDENGPVPGMYLMKLAVQGQLNKNTRPVSMTLPIEFHVDEVSLLIGSPMNADGQTAIVTPGGNGQTPGGIHIFGQ